MTAVPRAHSTLDLASKLIALTLLAGLTRLTRLPRATAAEVPDMSGEYHFLSPQDTLGILEEEGKLKGYLDVAQGEDESDAVLSYPITLGARQGDHVEFKTGKIHERYYRFTGAVQRGDGRAQADPDFLRLAGDLELVSIDPVSHQEHVEKRRAVFKWKGKSERNEEQ